MKKAVLAILLATFLSLGVGSKVSAAPFLQAAIGKVQGVADGKITVADTLKGNISQTLVGKATKIIGPDKKTLKLSAVKPDDLVAVVSTSTTTSGATPSSALIIYVKNASSSAQLKRQAVMGIITSINGSTITLTHPIQTNRVYTVIATNTTQIKIAGVTNTKLASLQPGMRVVAIGDTDNHGVITASRIHIIPGLAKGLPNQPTPAASGATPSASPSPTIQPSPVPTTSSASSSVISQ